LATAPTPPPPKTRHAPRAFTKIRGLPRSRRTTPTRSTRRARGCRYFLSTLTSSP